MVQSSTPLPRSADTYSHKYDYVSNTHDQALGRGRECEYSHVWEIQGENAPYPNIASYKSDNPTNQHKAKERRDSQKRELPSVPDITRTDRIYELTLSAKGIPGGNVIAAMNAQMDASQSTPSHKNTAGYSRRPGGPVYFELESQQQAESGNCSV